MLKPQKLAYGITALGIFMLVFCTLSGASIISEYEDSDGVYGAGSVSAYLKDTPEKGGKVISEEDILHLQQISFKDADMAYTSMGKSTVAYGENRVQADITGVSDGFSSFRRIPMISGSFITAGNCKEMVSVVDEQLAIGLFGNTNVLGSYLELYGQHFKIIGVAANDASIAGMMTDDGYGTVYMPVEHMLLYNKSAMITSMEIRVDGIGTNDISSDKMKEGLASIGQNAADYTIVDHSIEKKLLEEEAEAIAFLAGAGLLLMLMGSIRRRLLEICSRVKTLNERYYLLDILRLGYKDLLLNLLEIAVMSALAVLVWDTISFRLYIPAEYLPEELIDLGFFLDLAKSLMEEKVQSLGNIPSPVMMKSGLLGMLQGWNLAAAIFSGFMTYVLGQRLLYNRQEGRTRLMLYSCASIALSIAVSLLVLAVFKLPTEIDNKELMVVSSFILLSTMGPGENSKLEDKSLNLYTE